MTKEKLKKYKALKIEVKQIEQSLLEHFDTIYPGKMILDGLPKSKNISDSTAKLAIETIKLYGDLNAKKLEAVRLCKEIEGCIEKLEPVERVLMRERYILCKDWEEVCIAIGYSWRQTHHIHSVIINKFRTQPHT
jgi:hypothetical protein